MMTDALQQATILIVDDVPTNVQILADALSSGYRIKVASSGENALGIAQREPHPDLILLDVMMPDMDGFETCRRLKADTKTKNIPVIFVTAKDTHVDEELGLNLGAVDYIGKPFSIPITKARIRNHIQLKRQADLLEFQSMNDELTKMPNRRRFDQALALEWKRAVHDGAPLSLVLIDIDYFKQYNDCYGHVAGDVCLQMVAEELSKGVTRTGDLVVRYGGEEFVAILPETLRENALMIAEGLRVRIEKLGLPHTYPEAGSVVTVSLGVATQTKFEDNAFKQILDAADKALYRAKEGGRNRVCSNDG
jgi:diguanylate cyclase (GGDEF)-like protein